MLIAFIQILFYSFIATAFFLPVSTLDSYFLATFNVNNLWYILPFILIAELINANLIYKFSKTLSDKIIRKEKHKKKLEEIQNKIDKIGFWGIAIAGATPLPYSIILYSAGAVKWGNVRKFSLAVLIGRSAKYILLGIIAYFGIELFF